MVGSSLALLQVVSNLVEEPKVRALVEVLWP